MGVTLLHHRVVTGLYYNNNQRNNYKVKPNGKFTLSKNDFRIITYGVVCVIYIYLICLLLAGAIETAHDITATKFHRTYNIGLHVVNDLNSYLNCATLLIIMIAYSRQYNHLFAWIVKHGRLSHYFSAKRKCSGTQCLSNTRRLPVLRPAIVFII